MNPRRDFVVWVVTAAVAAAVAALLALAVMASPAQPSATSPAQSATPVQDGAPSTAERYRRELTVSARRTFGPDAPVAALAAQIHVESAWKTDARSRAGALGLAQFMPATANDMARRFPAECSPANPYSSRWALTCRDRYMASLLSQIKPIRGWVLSEQSQWAFAFRAYNGGSIIEDRRAAARAGFDPDHWEQVQPFNGRRRSHSNFVENTMYPVRIFNVQTRYSHWGRMVGKSVK